LERISCVFLRVRKGAAQEYKSAGKGEKVEEAKFARVPSRGPSVGKCKSPGKNTIQKVIARGNNGFLCG
jgi:hypothetical protein